MFAMSKRFAAVLTVSLLMSPFSSLQARTFDLREQAIYNDAFSDFVTNYDKAATEYRGKGPAAFVDALGTKRTESERAYLKKVLGSLPKLPKLSSDQALLVIDATEMGAGVHTVEVSNIDDGMLIVDGNPVEFDPAKTDLESLAKKIESSLDRTTMKVSALDSLSNLFIRPAHAKTSVAIWVVAGAVGGLATKWVMDWWGNRNSDADATRTATEKEKAWGLPAGHLGK